MKTKNAVIAAVSGLTLVGVVAVGVSQSDGPTNTPGPKVTTSVTQDPYTESVNEPEVGESTGPAGSAEGTGRFGSAFTYPDGVSVSVSQPKRYKPAGTTYGYEAGQVAYVATVTVRNGGSANLDLNSATVTGSSNTTEAGKVYDLDGSVDMTAPQTKVLSGRSKAWKVAFALPAGQALSQVEVLLDYAEHEGVVFAE